MEGKNCTNFSTASACTSSMSVGGLSFGAGPGDGRLADSWGRSATAAGHLGNDRHWAT